MGNIYVEKRKNMGALATYLSDGLQAAVRLELVDTMALGLAVRATLGDRAFAATTTDTNTEDGEALLGLVSETACLVRARRTRCTVESGHLAVLPNADTQQVAHHIALLFAVQLLDVSICPHVSTRVRIDPSNEIKQVLIRSHIIGLSYRSPRAADGSGA